MTEREYLETAMLVLAVISLLAVCIMVGVMWLFRARPDEPDPYMRDDPDRWQP